MGRPEFPKGVLTSGIISEVKQKQKVYDKNPDKYDKHKKDWSYNECAKRGCLPTGEPIGALYG